MSTGTGGRREASRLREQLMPKHQRRKHERVLTELKIGHFPFFGTGLGAWSSNSRVVQDQTGEEVAVEGAGE